MFSHFRVLERVGPRQLAAHVRTLCDFLVLEFSNSAGGQHVTKYVETMNSIIWVYNIVPIDRLMLCLVSIYTSIVKCLFSSLMQFIMLESWKFWFFQSMT